MNWNNEHLITDNCIGFIYIINHKYNDTYYIGKKQLTGYKTIKGKKVYKESNWKTYFGSNKEFLQYVKTEGKENFERTILICCDTKIKLTYNELKFQILLNWESEKCFNQNILGKVFKSKIKNCCND